MFRDTVLPAPAFSPLSRRAVMRGGAAALAGGVLAGPLLAQKAQDWPKVARFVSDAVRQRKVAGMVAALGWQQRAPDYITAGTRSFGGRDVVGADTLWRIYSMTKPITGIAAVMCIEDGKLALDQPLHEILPAFRNLWVQKTYDGPVSRDNLEELKRPITIRHLLTHTAGLGYTIVQQGPIRAAYIARDLSPAVLSRLQLANEVFGPPPRYDLATFADKLAEVPLVEQPGTRWRYSVSMDLLGRVIEVISGQRFDTFLKRRIFDPCGMTSTFFQVPGSEAHRLAANYFILGGMPLPLDPPDASVFLDKPPFPFGGSGLVSSARDFDRFLQMLAGRGAIGGEQVMSEASVALATSDLFPDTLAPGGGFRGDEFGFGAGGLVGRGEAAGTYGWFGAAGTSGLVNTRLALRTTLMTQYMPAEAYPYQEEFPRLAFADALAQMAARRVAA